MDKKGNGLNFPVERNKTPWELKNSNGTRSLDNFKSKLVNIPV